MEHPCWPLFDLRLVTERLTLRLPLDEDLPDLVALAEHGVHDPATMPFEHPWTDQSAPGPARGLSVELEEPRAELEPDSWTLGFLVSRRSDGAPIGVQDLLASGFPLCRTVSTASWLGLEHQGLGLGTEMRSAVLHFAFDELDATAAETGAWHDNPASIGVTKRLGYRENGENIQVRRGEPTRQRCFRLTADEWRAASRPEVAVAGADGTRALLGLVDGDPGAPGPG